MVYTRFPNLKRPFFNYKQPVLKILAAGMIAGMIAGLLLEMLALSNRVILCLPLKICGHTAWLSSALSFNLYLTRADARASGVGELAFNLDWLFYFELRNFAAINNTDK